uniref:Putative myosin-i heavy chain-like protein n=1 Tax=Ixodes ricinus TaxID=34613 RepID=A0A147BHM0_IXORI
MDRASRAIRRSGARLKALNGGHADLNLVISELRDIRLAMKSFLTAQNSVSQDLVLWAQADENRVIQDVMSQLAELNTFWTDVQRDFVEHLKAFKHHFDLILEGEKQVDQARNALVLCEQKELKIKKELKKASKKATVEEISNLELKLAQAERAKDLAQYEAMEKVQENEAVKLIRVKEGLLKLSEAYLELANKCAIIFESQRDIAAHIPDVHHMALHEMKYTGTGAMKQAVQKAKDRVDQYHLYQYRLIPHCPSVEEPPPPYTPGYYDPTTGQPYHVPGGDEAAFGSVRQRVVLPSCPAPAFGGGRGLARPPPVPQQLPSRPPGGNNNPDWLLPRDAPAACPPSPWPPAWGSDGEEEDRLSAAMGAARLG